ncbi:MAG: tyrosine--tRNA ligase [Candidatus Methanomethyliales bacterium]|nr:tyrosine--tRNA ligase [Candidatus Methanomethylicales archaeon]
MDVVSKVEKVIKDTQEVITRKDLQELFESNSSPKGYIGVEPSGLFHLGWVIWVNKLKDLMDVGVKMTLLEATWHAWINDKFGGDIAKINACASYIEHSLRALGVDVGRLNFLKADEMVDNKVYWEGVLKIAKALSLSRIKRAVTIMGRKEDESVVDFSKLIYPCMQVEDIFFLDLDICLGGMDQRRAHVLAREVAEVYSYKKPVAIHTPLLPGLQGKGRMEGTLTEEEAMIEQKMSKSKPETCIFIHDSPEEIKSKINKAYCPPMVVEGNPILEIATRIILNRNDKFVIKRDARYGGDLIVESAQALVTMYSQGKIHPLDLKNAVSEELSTLLAPVRDYFSKNKEAQDLVRQLK